MTEQEMLELVNGVADTLRRNDQFEDVKVLNPDKPFRPFTIAMFDSRSGAEVFMEVELA